MAAVGAKTASMAPGRPWENDHVEGFNARLPDELLDGEIFTSLKEAQFVNAGWRRGRSQTNIQGGLRGMGWSVVEVAPAAHRASAARGGRAKAKLWLAAVSL